MKLSLSFDVGHSSIGWSVLEINNKQKQVPDIIGCGAVLFEKDSALASQRRLHRSQRRHVRATRQRIARIEKLFLHLGIFTPAEIEIKHQASGGHAAPWLLAARVLSRKGKQTLNWTELWDVIRWYAHNRGYDPLTEETEATQEDTDKVTLAREAMETFGQETMAETICAWLGIDPQGSQIASSENYKAKGAAFPRAIVCDEVRTILTGHIGKLPKLDERLITTLLDDATTIPCPDIRFPKRYQGGLLFGRLAMRYHNRIIGICPLSETKRPLKDCPEYYRHRWAMLLSNIKVSDTDVSPHRPLNHNERNQLNQVAQTDGYFTPGAFRKTARRITGAQRDNLAQMFMDSTSEENLVLDPALRLARGNKQISSVWAHLPESLQRHALNRWRRGRSQTLGELRAEAEKLSYDLAPFDQALAAYCAAPVKKTRSKKTPPLPTPEDILATPFKAKRLGGRAPYSRALLNQSYDEVMSDPPIHPREEGGCLFETPAQRRANDERTIDQQTNNHLVRHRLAILGRLLDHLIADPTYGAGDPSRISRLVLEVNRDLREMSGLTAQDIAKEMNERLRDHSKVSKYLSDKLPTGTPINASLIRKGRIAADLGWRCPYTGQEFEPIDLITKRVDLDHIIPRSLRQSDSLDSLVVTFSAINKIKGARTARQFIEEFQSQSVPGTNLQIMTGQRYEEFVKRLDTRGHSDDLKRKKRRKERLLLFTFDEKTGGFTPGQLTQTSQLSRLGQQVLFKPFAHLEKQPRFIALPGQLTARARSAWKVLGCLTDAAPDVLETTTDADGTKRNHIKTKTEIRNITHLHHALDACVIGLAADRFPRGEIWQALLERRPNATQRAQLEALQLGQFDHGGGFYLRDLPDELKKQLRLRLAECRVVQHIPSDMSGIKVEENTRGVIGRENGRVILRQSKPDSKGNRTLNETSELEEKVIGLPELNGKGGKLAAIKGVRVITANFGVAILDDATLPPSERFVIIPHVRVWEQIQKLRVANNGKHLLILRIGMHIKIPTGRYQGRWVVRGVQKNSRAGLLLDLSLPDVINYRDSKTAGGKQNVSLKTLIKDGLSKIPLNLSGS